MCAHGGTGDPLSRCIINSNYIRNDTVGDRSHVTRLLANEMSVRAL